ncbi:MAG: response regulator transcription factor [Dehalococcoidales bacterium]|nr:response regulator transcription factor [Dehalococcoidales bacterium]
MVDQKSVIENTSRSVVVGHPDTLLAEGIAAILEKGEYLVLGKANTESSLNEQALQYIPDIILFEPAICNRYVDVIRKLRQQVPSSVIVLMIKRGGLNEIAQAIEAGVSGCISLDVSPEEFIKSLELLSAGNVVVSKAIANDIRKNLDFKLRLKPIEILSVREREVLLHIGNGSSNRQIACKLFVSEHTVKVHVRSILNKLSLKNRQQAAAYAAKEGLIKDLSSQSSEDSP